VELREQSHRGAYRIEDPRRRIARYCKHQPPDIAEAIEEALQAIAKAPYKPLPQRCAVRHMKGQLLCCREFRKLPDARRIRYHVEDKSRVVTIEYVGPHP